ncbi:MAG: FAD-dependent oxidoreductase [Candidatus Sumerlaeaceae bacterium]|nr:FAD-dependent oxidoreductase [Candidatus Sumerlaeaceae bacterium]
MSKRILIIGAGPTGLGAAWRLEELGHANWLLLEKGGVAGGLAGSVTDDKGFTWDMGGHVQFSHYQYFDDLMDTLLGADGWLHHERESWVWIRDRFVPYPFQMNIRLLPRDEMKECVAGLVRLYKNPPAGKPANFGEWVDATFGAGLARVFMRPYNFKVWAYPLEMMNATWVGERVATVDLERVLNNIFDERDEVSWGPNNTFRFPKFGGTGSIWRECARRLPAEKLRYGAEVVRIDTATKKVHLADGSSESYDHLLNTMPLDKFLRQTELTDLQPLGDKLLHSSTHIFGIGLRGKPSAEVQKKCWMYFPEDNCPFYRVTVFSNYSPNNVPDISEYWSLMAEVSESPQKSVPATPEARLEEVIQGMLNTRLIASRADIASTWQIRLEHGYPTPSCERDAVIYDVLPKLDRLGIASRGRFGAWRYEVSNQDHSVLQGVEWVNSLLKGEKEMTLWHPDVVNGVKR